MAVTETSQQYIKEFLSHKIGEAPFVDDFVDTDESLNGTILEGMSGLTIRTTDGNEYLIVIKQRTERSD